MRQRHVEQQWAEMVKTSALASGLRASEAALAMVGGVSAVTVHEYATTGGIPLRIGDLYMNVPFEEDFTAEADVMLDAEDDVLWLAHGGHRERVDEVFPLPGYIGIVHPAGFRVDDLVFSHMDRARLSPIVGCAYNCAFCDLPGRITLRPLDQLLAAAGVAMADTVLPVRHLLISGGSPGPRDQGRFIDTVHGLVAALSPTVDVDVMMSSAEYTPEMVRRLVAAGVHGFALNIELFSDPASTVHVRAKHRRSRPHFDETVSTAVRLLGPGRVRSLIIPGLEPAEETVAGVEHIASLGADPVLSPFRPAAGTKLSAHRPVSAALLREVLEASREAVARHGVALGPRCTPCQHNTLTFPWDASPIESDTIPAVSA